ncbi:helix-turn-helix domain-containing protein [Streptomyces sp. NPDC096033]|uniref:helix-turn-helix domain-containing protein n=1 Tax=Streptomyces sp. NPDC096033 TaxID=3366071 RepID=UPI0037F2D760
MEAAAMFAAGWGSTDIAKELQVSVRSVQRWRRAWKTAGRNGVRSRGPAPRPTPCSRRSRPGGPSGVGAVAKRCRANRMKASHAARVVSSVFADRSTSSSARRTARVSSIRSLSCTSALLGL